MPLLANFYHLLRLTLNIKWQVFSWDILKLTIMTVFGFNSHISVLVILFILSFAELRLDLRHILGTFCPCSLCRMKTLTQTRNYTSEELYSIEILLLEEKASALKIKTEPGCRRKAIKSDCISCKAQRRIFLFQICFRLCWKHQEIYSKFLWRKSAK